MLSRHPLDLQQQMDGYTEMMLPEVVSAALLGSKAAQRNYVPWVAALQRSCDDETVPADYVSGMTSEDIRAEQQQDPAIKEVVSLKLNARHLMRKING